MINSKNDSITIPKHAGGRPRRFKTAKELEDKCCEYIKNCPDKRIIYVTEDGQKIEAPHPTITGLALYLGYVSRSSCYDQEKNEEYSDIIKRAKSYIEMNYEKALMGNSVTGAIFALKNMGWRDRQEIEQTGNVGLNLIVNPIPQQLHD